MLRKSIEILRSRDQYVFWMAIASTTKLKPSLQINVYEKNTKAVVAAKLQEENKERRFSGPWLKVEDQQQQIWCNIKHESYSKIFIWVFGTLWVSVIYKEVGRVIVQRVRLFRNISRSQSVRFRSFTLKTDLMISTSCLLFIDTKRNKKCLHVKQLQPNTKIWIIRR